jgi:murein L,D-transpeptidase YcbB/YkuD
VRTLAAILVFALPTGWAAFAATTSGTDHKTAPKTAAKKSTGTKASPGKTSTPAGSTSAVSKSTGGASTSKMSINKTSSTGKIASAASKTGTSHAKETSAATGTSKTASSKTGTSKNNTKLQASNRYRRSTQLTPTTDRYREIQQALADKGYFGATADGSWGPTSVDALKRFQHDQSLIEDGKIGSLSLIALGLGPKRGGTSFLAAPAHEPESVTDSDSQAAPPAFQTPDDQE